MLSTSVAPTNEQSSLTEARRDALRFPMVGIARMHACVCQPA